MKARELIVLLLIIAWITHAHALEDVQVGTRALGLSGAFVGLGDDASAIRWNPAGLALLRQPEITLMYTDLYNTGLMNSHLASAFPLTARHHFGIDWTYLGTDDNELKYTNNHVHVAYSFAVSNWLSLGLSGKYLWADMSLDGIHRGSVWRASSDVACLISPFKTFIPALDALRMGIIVRDAFSTSIKHDDEDDESVSLGQVQFGMSYRLLPHWTVVGQIDNRYHFGTEYWFKSLLGIRAGIQKDWDTSEPLSWSLGLSVRVPTSETFRPQLDYAYLNSPTLPDTHRFALRLPYDFNDVRQLFGDKAALVEIEFVDSELPLFASLYKRYGKDKKIEPVGYLKVRNKHTEALRIIVRLSVEGYIDEPREILRQTLPVPMSPIEKPIPIPLYVDFPPEIVNFKVSQSAEISATVHVEYEGLEGFQPAETTVGLKFQSSGKVPFSDHDGVKPYVALIDSDDPLIRDFAQQISNKYDFPEIKRVLPLKRYNRIQLRVYATLFKAMAIYETLNALEIYYVPDPNAPYERLINTKTRGFIPDDVRYPRKLLAKRGGGDCDDFSVLYASLLESIRIRTALVDMKGHVFVMFDTGIPERAGGVLSLPENTYILWNRSIWIPIDPPRQLIDKKEIDDSFWAAWQQGLRQYEAYQAYAKRGPIVEVQEAQEGYPPAYPPDQQSPFPSPDSSKIDPLMSDSLAKLHSRQVTYDLSQKERLELPFTPEEKLVLLNERGILAGLNEDQDEAHQMFNQALELRADFAPSINNKANLHLIAWNYQAALNLYQQASELHPNDPGVLINLALTYLVLGDKPKATQFFRHALKQFGSIPEACYQLAIPVKQMTPPERVQPALVTKLHAIMESIDQGRSIEDIEVHPEDLRETSVGIYWKHQ